MVNEGQVRLCKCKGRFRKEVGSSYALGIGL